MNPCKCGWNGDSSGRCKCSPTSVANYRSRISGPLLDRIDIIVEVPAVQYEDLQSREETESSASMKANVNRARKIQEARYKDRAITCNARMGPDEMREFCKLDKVGNTLMEEAFNDYGLTARSYDRILKVARTIADIEGSKDILPAHIGEAIQFRTINI
jgi:magnesium chelatase family protein